MATPRQGFKATRTLNGTNPVLRRFNVNVDANHTYRINDPVVLNASGEVELCTAATSANFLGVIQAVGTIDQTGTFQQLTFNQPNRGPFLTSGQTGVALVNVDPHQIYVAQIDVSASAGIIGNTVHVSAGPGNDVAGISGFNLAGATLGTDAERPFKIVGIAPSEFVGTNRNGDFPAGSGVEVQLNASIFNTSTGV